MPCLSDDARREATVNDRGVIAAARETVVGSRSCSRPRVTNVLVPVVQFERLALTFLVSRIAARLRLLVLSLAHALSDPVDLGNQVLRRLGCSLCLPQPARGFILGQAAHPDVCWLRNDINLAKCRRTPGRSLAFYNVYVKKAASLMWHHGWGIFVVFIIRIAFISS